MGNINGMYIDEDDAKYFKMHKNMVISNQKCYNKAKDQFQEVIDEYAELELKSRPKPKEKKKPKNKKAEEEEEDDKPKPPPGKPRLCSILRDVIRSEKFEDRLEHHSEVDTIKKKLITKGIVLPTDVLEKAIFMPDDEELPPEYQNNSQELITQYLFKNPFPKEKGKKKKGKKK